LGINNEEKSNLFTSIIVDDYKKIMNHFVNKFKLDKETGEDIFHDVFIICANTIKKNGGTFPFRSSYKGYFYEALKNTYFNFSASKRRKFIEPISTYDELHNSNLISDEFLTSEEEKEEEKTFVTEELYNSKLIKSRLLLLDDDLRECVLLHYYDKKSYKDISKVLNVTFNVVRNRLYKARQILKK